MCADGGHSLAVAGWSGLLFASSDVGTDFDPYRTKAEGNQDLLPWLGAGLHPNTGFEPRVVNHPDGRVVLFEVGTARDQPVCFYGTAYVRVGAGKIELSRHPEKARAIWTRGSDWSAEVCERARLDDLDAEALAKAREQFVIKHPARVRQALLRGSGPRLGARARSGRPQRDRSGLDVNQGTRSRPEWELWSGAGDPEAVESPHSSRTPSPSNQCVASRGSR